MVSASLAVVGLAGLAVATYLTIERALGRAPSCIVGGGCTVVQASKYSELAGIPVAVLGLVAYATLLVAAILPGPLGRALGLFTAVVGVGFSAWLTYAELFLIAAVCAWCVASAVLITLALILTAWRAARAGSDPAGSADRSAQGHPPPAPSPRSSR